MVVFEVAVFLALFAGVTAYQTRNLLETNREDAPPLSGITLGGERYDLSDHAGKPVLVYFFAPWCVFCGASADNLDRLRRLRSEESLEIVNVALDWETGEEVAGYVEKHDLDVTVVLGVSTIASDWRVQGFPTYYVLNSNHRIVRRDFGYSTQFGLWWRTWFVD